MINPSFLDFACVRRAERKLENLGRLVSSAACRLDGGTKNLPFKIHICIYFSSFNLSTYVQILIHFFDFSLVTYLKNRLGLKKDYLIFYGFIVLFPSMHPIFLQN